MKKKTKTVNAEFVIKFNFSSDETFEQIADRLDTTLIDERNKAIEAIGKFLGGSVEWIDEIITSKN